LGALPLAVSMAFRHILDDPHRAVGLGSRIGMPTSAVRVADRLAQKLSGESTAAREAWQQGRLGDAIAILATSSGRSARRIQRLRERVRNELLHPALPVPRTSRAIRRPTGTAPVSGRVLHLVTNSLPTTTAGYTVRTQAILRAQRAIGLDAHVATRLGFPVSKGVLDARSSAWVDGVPYHRLLPTVMPRAGEAALSRQAELAAALVERIRPAVLHAATDHHNGRVALAVGRRYGLPVVYEVRGFLEETWLTQGPGRTTDAEFYRARRDLETWCMRNADRVLTLGATMKAEIASRGVSSDRIVVVPNAVDDEFLEPLPDGSALRSELGLTPEDYVVGTVATLTSHEGLGTLLAAGAVLRRRGIPIRLLIIGDGQARPALEQEAARLGLTDGTAIFTGRVPHDRVREHHGLLDVFAVPRTNERVCHLVTPLKPVEAMASGLVVAASDVQAMGDLVEPDVTGVLIPAEDVEAWSESLESLFYDPGRRQALGVAARASIESGGTWKHVAEITRSVYRTLGAA
jgi:glycosyltransferase involved in cell wall biosynthesis